MEPHPFNPEMLLMSTVLLIWALTTVASLIGGVLFLAFDEWQVRARASAATRREIRATRRESEAA